MTFHGFCLDCYHAPLGRTECPADQAHCAFKRDFARQRLIEWEDAEYEKALAFALEGKS
jgi:hypothetical protein